MTRAFDANAFYDEAFEVDMWEDDRQPSNSWTSQPAPSSTWTPKSGPSSTWTPAPGSVLMADVTITHRKVSGKAAGPNAAKIYGPHWQDLWPPLG